MFNDNDGDDTEVNRSNTSSQNSTGKFTTTKKTFYYNSAEISLDIAQRESPCDSVRDDSTWLPP